MKKFLKRLHFSRQDLKALAVLLGLYFLQWYLKDLDLGAKTLKPDSGFALGAELLSIIQPKRIASLFFALAAVEVLAGILHRLLGVSWGSLLEGFLGGLVSSTAVTARLALKSKRLSAQNVGLLTSSLLMGLLAMFLEMVLILYIGSEDLLIQLAPLLISSCVALLIVAVYSFYRATYARSSSQVLTAGQEEARDASKVVEPELLNIKDLIKLAAFISVLFILVALAQRFLGSEAVLAVSFVGGLFELHGLTLVTSQVVSSGSVALSEGKTALALALTAAFVSKILILRVSAEAKFARHIALVLASIWAVGILAYFII